jgi:hypothetical protein
MGAAIKGFGGAVTAGLSIGLLTGLATKAINYARSIKTVSEQLGVTTKELQNFRYAAAQSGTTVAEADKGLEKLGLAMSKAAAGSKPTIAAFNAVGVSVEDIKTKSKTEIFGQIADQMIKQGGAAKNAAAGNVIFGEGMAKLAPLLDRGKAGLDELSAANERLGGVLSDPQIQNADETARKLNDVKMVLAAQISGVVADNAQSIVSLAQALGQLTSQIINFLGSNPQLALAILGGLAGSRFGLPGAAGGALAGAFAGSKLAESRDTANTDKAFRAKAIRDALANYRAAKAGAGGVKGEVNPAAVKAARAELERQVSLGLKAAAAKSGTKGGVPPLAVPEFLAGAPKGGGGGRKRTPRAPRADHSAETALTDAFQFDQQLRRAQIDVLRATQNLSNDAVERYSISIQIKDAEKAAYDAELRYQVELNKLTEGKQGLTEAQATQLKLDYDRVDQLERDKLVAEEQARAREESNRFDQLAFDLERDLLQS